MLKGLFGFSGDPITHGHLELIERAARLVDELWVVFFENGSKKQPPLLPKQEQLNLLKGLTSNLPNVRVACSKKLLVDYALEKGIGLNIRGLRGGVDLGYEMGLERANASQGLGGLETIYLLASKEMAFISSSAARMVLTDGGDASQYIPYEVKQAIELHVHGRLSLSLTGSIASGKSTIAKALVLEFAKQGFSAHHIDCDDLVRAIYRSADDEHFPNLRRDLTAHFGKGILDEDGRVVPKRISQLVFESPNPKAQLVFLQSVLRAPLVSSLRKRTKTLRGIVVVEGTMMAEYQLLSQANHQVLLVDLGEKEQLNRLQARDKLSKEVARKRINYAGSSAEKQQAIREAFGKGRGGHLFVFDNTNELSSERIRLLALKIKHHYKLSTNSFE